MTTEQRKLTPPERRRIEEAKRKQRRVRIAVLVSGLIVVVVMVLAVQAASQPDEWTLARHAEVEARCGEGYDVHSETSMRDPYNQSLTTFETEAGGTYALTFLAKNGMTFEYDPRTGVTSPVEGESYTMVLCDGEEYLGERWNGKARTMEPVE